MRHILSRSRLLVIATAVLLAVAACGGKGTNNGSTASDILHMSVELEQTGGFTPVQFGRGNTVFSYQLYDSLVRVDQDTQEPKPQLATSWAWNADRTQLTMHLRDDVKFHDGSSLTADAVKFTWDYMMDKKNSANLNGLINQFISGVTVVDQQTFVFSVIVPSNGIFDLLELYYVLNPAKVGSLTTGDAGSGPYTVASYTPGQRYTMKAVPDYWGGKPKISTIDVTFIADGEAQLAALQGGTEDLVFLLNYDTIARVKSDSSLKLLLGPLGSQNAYLTLNTAHTPFQNKLVRQAMAMALNRNAIVKTVYSPDIAASACQPFATGSQFNDPNLHPPTCEFDLDKAKALLAQAGYPNGFSTSVNVSNNYGPPKAPQIAQLYQQDLKKIGVDLKINVLEGTDARAKFIGGQFDMELHTFQGSNTDPALLHPSTTWGSVPNSFNHFNDPVHHAMQVAAASEMDLTKRKQLYSQYTTYTLDQAYLDVIAYQKQVSAARTNVQGVEWGVNGYPILAGSYFG